MSATFLFGFSAGAGALVGWLLYVIERSRRKSAQLAETKANDEAYAAGKRLQAAESSIEAARATVERLRADADRCGDPVAVRADLDSLSEELSPPGAPIGGAVSNDKPTALDLIEGDLE